MQSSFYKLHPRLGSDTQSAFRNAMGMDIGLASSFRQSEMRRDGTHAMVMTLPSQLILLLYHYHHLPTPSLLKVLFVTGEPTGVGIGLERTRTREAGELIALNKIFLDPKKATRPSAAQCHLRNYLDERAETLEHNHLALCYPHQKLTHAALRVDGHGGS